MGINFYGNNGFDHDADMLLIIITIVRYYKKSKYTGACSDTMGHTQKKKLAEYKLST